VNPQAALLRHCLNAYRQANRPNARDRKSLGDEILWAVSPCHLAQLLKARLLSPSTLGVDWLGLAGALLTEVYADA